MFAYNAMQSSATESMVCCLVPTDAMD
jgi:hypothetical protein